MRSFHSQNLTDDRLPTWRHGRAWWRRWRAEWLVFMRPGLCISLQKGGYKDTEIQFHLAFLFFSIYISRSFGRCFEERTLSVYWFEGSVWLKLWCDDDYHRDRPWHRNTIALHVKDWIIGSPKYSSVKGEPIDVLVPMPEGCYEAVVTPDTATWTYRFGFKKTRDSYWIDIPGGIPFSGKGENSWDCGDDGLWGTGGDSVEKAIGNAVASVLESRRRYGHTNETRGRVVMARPKAETSE